MADGADDIFSGGVFFDLFVGLEALVSRRYCLRVLGLIGIPRSLKAAMI